MAQKRLSDFFLSVSKRTRNENEDETVEQLEQKQDEKDKQEVEKGKQVKTTGMLRKVRFEWKQLYPWLDYKMGKCFVCGVVSMVTCQMLRLPLLLEDVQI